MNSVPEVTSSTPPPDPLHSLWKSTGGLSCISGRAGHPNGIRTRAAASKGLLEPNRADFGEPQRTKMPACSLPTPTDSEHRQSSAVAR